MAGDKILPLAARRDEIMGRRAAIEHRLNDGYQRIEQALQDGADVEAWEDFWVHLLGEYEAVCDQLSLAA